MTSPPGAGVVLAEPGTIAAERGRGRRVPVRCYTWAALPDADLTIRLQPRAKRNAVVEERDGVLHVSVAAAAVGGQANAALCKLLAKRLHVPRTRVQIVRGERSREKVVRVEGMALAEARAALGLPA